MNSIPPRLYQPLWEQIKADKLAHIEANKADQSAIYLGTVAQDITPALARRIEKAVRKEKNSFDGINWPMGHYMKLVCCYNPEKFELHFRLVPYRKFEARARLMSKFL